MLKNNLFCFVFIFLYACSSDDSKSAQNPLILDDFTITIVELPINANDFLGTLESNMAGSFTLVNENPTGALFVDSATGDITIADVTQFDYEINTEITATAQISTGIESDTATITIMINNIDDIEFYLSSSKQDYTDANVDDWILITEDEYNTLAASLNEVSKIATSDAYYDFNEMIFGANSPATWANDNGLTIPNESYVFALKYYSSDDNASNTKVKQSSTSISEGYIDLGNTLPIHNSGEHYFVLKGNGVQTSDIGYLAIYSSVSIGFKPFSESMYAGEPGDANTFFNTNLSNSIIMYQGLSTTLKQWE